MNKDIHSMDGTFIFRKPDSQACDPPSLIEVRLPGYCKQHKFDNTPPIVNATLLWMWEQLPSKVLIREGQTKPARKAWWSAFTGGAASYFYHGAFEPEFNSEAARGITTLVRVLKTFDTMVPCNQCIVDGQAYILATPGQEYVAYFPNGRTAQINLQDKTNIWEYKWFNPRSCQFTGGDQTTGQSIYIFTTPDNNDWVLWIWKTNK
ncbi:MAG: hypothetical protein JSV03_00280 [Planctomycetota bacterium]|nr:MAG: hypothetical protein JSV03_00280 [Planctomycetota bacterium]